MKFLVLIFLQGCEDERDCSSIAQMSEDDLNKYCERWKNDAAVKQCAKTCQFCKYKRWTEPETDKDTREKKLSSAKRLSVTVENRVSNRARPTDQQEEEVDEHKRAG